jgi:predicted O-methyltransferase YrrM
MLFYDGGPDPNLLQGPTARALADLGAVVHPSPRRMRWGSLHQFAVDCMRFALSQLSMDTLTIVDSDQLALRPSWSATLGRYLAEQGAGVGLLGNMPERLPAQTKIPAAFSAWQEVELWRPLLRRFPDGENKFVHWTFWPSTVFTADAARALVQMFDQDAQLHHLLDRSRLWVTEEIFFPTLAALLGFRIVHSPGSYDYVRYRHPYTAAELDAALARPDAYWVHPIPRHYQDPLRVRVRRRHGEYAGAGGTAIPPNVNEIRPTALTVMKQVQGWLFDDEADLLITVADQALAACPEASALVEIGSYCGKATTVLANVVRAMRPAARVWAIDPHDGVVGDLDRSVSRNPPTLDTFRRNIGRAGLSDFVETVQARTADVAWSAPICLLLVDGLHDYGSVSRDFQHFEPFLADAALIAFHDYADYFPGVQKFVDELLRTNRYRQAHRASSLIVLQKLAVQALADAQPAPAAQAAG